MFIYIYVNIIYHEYFVLQSYRGDIMTIGEKIRNKRKELGITQKELAAIMNVGQSYISQYENDYLSPGFDTLEKFASGIGCSVADLLPIETLTTQHVQNLPPADSSTIISRLEEIEKDFDEIVDREGFESIYNALLETLRFLKSQSLPDPERAQLLRLFDGLNQEGRQRLTDYALDLTSIDKYTTL